EPCASLRPVQSAHRHTNIIVERFNFYLRLTMLGLSFCGGTLSAAPTDGLVDGLAVELLVSLVKALYVGSVATVPAWIGVSVLVLPNADGLRWADAAPINAAGPEFCAGFCAVRSITGVLSGGPT